MQNLKPVSHFVLFLHCYVKGFAPKCIALKADVLLDWKIYCLQVRLCIFQPRNITGWGSEGVNLTHSLQLGLYTTSSPKWLPANKRTICCLTNAPTFQAFFHICDKLMKLFFGRLYYQLFTEKSTTISKLCSKERVNGSCSTSKD